MSPKRFGTTPALSSASTPKTDRGNRPLPFIRPLRAGSLQIPGNIFSAPMAGYSDWITRDIALEAGAFLAFTEMISAEALVRGSRRTESMMKRGLKEEILAVQLFGSEASVLSEASNRAVELGANILDLNAGCPVPKITGKGAGAALGRNIDALARAVEAMSSYGVPVTVKIRSGWDEKSEN